MMSGPCELCGATDYAASYGGPDICPACDCGDFGQARVKRQGKRIATLEARVKELEEDVVGRTDEIVDAEIKTL